jgi:hypothetical protein
MNPLLAAASNDTTQYSRFVWRRLEEPIRVLGQELSSALWVVLVTLVLVGGLVYVVRMYLKDSRGVGLAWASLLALLRLSVYALLAGVFMLPAMQTFVKTSTRDRVLVLFDVSGSMQTSDELYVPGKEKQETRQDKVIGFVTDDRIDFFGRLQALNPVTTYRLGTRLDDQAIHFLDGKVLTREEKEKPQRDKDGNIIPPEGAKLSLDYWNAWLEPLAKLEERPERSDAEKDRLGTLLAVNKKVIADGLITGTNLGDSIKAALDKEGSGQLQGVVVFTDGRNTEGSTSAFRDLEARAKASHIPIFVVGVGEIRQKVKIEIVDIRLPQQVQPEDRFRAAVEVTGEGLAGQKVDLTLDVVQVRKNKKGEEERLPIKLIEAENKDNPSAKREEISLGSEPLEIKPEGEVVFDRGTPPRAVVEFQLDAAALAAARKIDLANDERFRSHKWEIGETKDDAELKFQARVPTDSREGLREKVHKSERVDLRVIKKPIRVLLFAASANKDYQFLRSLLVREHDKKRMDLTIHLQLPPGVEGFKEGKEGRVQDVEPERLLPDFPTTFEAKSNRDDLSWYDVIVAFDPDWNRLTRDQTRNLRKWSARGGGLVMVAGYINTVELIRPHEGEEADKFAPILDLLPVALEDRRDYLDRKTDNPYTLDFQDATPDLEFLRLDEELDESRFKEDWDAFFYGSERQPGGKREVERGFFNFYPVRQAKVGCTAVARFGDKAAALKDGSLHPYIVLSPSEIERVIWIGSAETWRLREFKQSFHERFWMKLIRYAGMKSQNRGSSRIRLEMNNRHVQNKVVPIEAQIRVQGGDPLDRTIKPEVSLVKAPPALPEKEAKKKFYLMPRTANRDGWFTGGFLVKVPGDYEVQVKVPETGDTETRKFTVTESNPELDDTRPDFDRMYRLASEADEVINRVSDTVAQELKRRLTRPKLGAGEDAKDKGEISDDKARLYFDLKNAELIPSCMVSRPNEQESRGPVDDLWDKGFQLGQIDLPYALLAGVALLSVEWLIRKLLRLA